MFGAKLGFLELQACLRGYYKGTIRVPLKGSIRDMGVSEN